MIVGMSFTEVSDQEMIQTLVHDPDWVAEQKMDGTRVIAEVTPEGVHFMQRQGQPLKHAAAVLHLPRLEEELMALRKRSLHSRLALDGELIIGTGAYHVFDLIHSDESDENSSYGYRREVLDEVMRHQEGGTVYHTYRATTAPEKATLLELAEKAGVEGVMFKNLEKPYEQGVRVKHVIKVKFVKSADVVVTEVNRGRTALGRETGSIKFAVYAGEQLTDIGACSVIGKPHVEPGDVIEVAYLYWTGSTTYQPRMKTIRQDKDPMECGLDQFAPYSREVVR